MSQIDPVGLAFRLAVGDQHIDWHRDWYLDLGFDAVLLRRFPCSHGARELSSIDILM